MDPTFKQFLITALTVGLGLLSKEAVVKFIDYLKARRESADTVETKRLSVKGREVDASVKITIAKAEAELATNRMLAERVKQLEERLDAATDTQDDRLARLADELRRECEKQRMEDAERHRTQLEAALVDARNANLRNAQLTRDYDHMRSDMAALREHVARLEQANRDLRAMLEERTSDAPPARPKLTIVEEA